MKKWKVKNIRNQKRKNGIIATVTMKHYGNKTGIHFLVLCFTIVGMSTKIYPISKQSNRN